ncbi:MAG: hypothetical protein ACT4RN_01310 [Pseudonocardia sp.]
MNRSSSTFESTIVPDSFTAGERHDLVGGEVHVSPAQQRFDDPATASGRTVGRDDDSGAIAHDDSRPGTTMLADVRQWDVRPILIVSDATVDEGRHRRVAERLRDRGFDFTGMISCGPGGSIGLSGTFVVQAPTPGAAADACIDALAAAAAEEGLRVVDHQEIVVVPGWRDERDW